MVALLLTAVSAPANDLNMIASANVMDVMADSGHGGCDDTKTKTCDGSALCMTACGKLPLQLVAALGFVPAGLARKSVREPDIDLADLSPSPLRRPPRML